MKNDISISVIIPTYNNQSTIAEAIESCLNQITPPQEIIVINDGSTDSTQHILAKYREKIITINQPNAGVSEARNRGAFEAKSDWLVFLDADDTFLPNRISSHASMLATNPSIEAIIGNQYEIHPDGKKIQSSQKTKIGQYLAKKSEKIGSCTLDITECARIIEEGMPEIRTLSIKKSTFLKIGGFPSRVTIGEDLALFFFVLSQSKCIYSNEVVANYHIHDASALRKNPLSTRRRFIDAIGSIDTNGAPDVMIKSLKRKEAIERVGLSFALCKNGDYRQALLESLIGALKHPSKLTISAILSILYDVIFRQKPKHAHHSK